MRLRTRKRTMKSMTRKRRKTMERRETTTLREKKMASTMTP